MNISKMYLERCIDAIIVRDAGVGYLKAIDKHLIAPITFYEAVKNIEALAKTTNGQKRRTLAEIAKDEERRANLFRMDEELIRKRYDQIQRKEETSFFPGTYLHPENIEALVYYAFVSNNPQLGSSDRGELVQAMKRLRKDLQDYFHQIGLGGLMQKLGKGRQNSSLAVIGIFDTAYQKRTGQPSLFDYAQNEHLHPWDFKVPNSYWKDRRNVRGFAYHTLTERIPALGSSNRSEVIQAIIGLPKNLQLYIKSIMGKKCSWIFRDTTEAAIRAFDEGYQEKTGDASLFDLRQEHHLHHWEIFRTRGKYKDAATVEGIIYHTLVEAIPELSSGSREIVVQGIKKLLSYGLQNYFFSLGLRGVMKRGFKKGEVNSPEAVLKVFDRAYMKETKDASLFEENKSPYIKLVVSKKKT